MDLTTRVTNLEKEVSAILDIINRNEFYTDADIAGTRQGISDNSEEIQENRDEIGATEDAVCELSGTTEESIAALEQAVCDLSEEINNDKEGE